jgi:hypothetical protein
MLTKTPAAELQGGTRLKVDRRRLRYLTTRQRAALAIEGSKNGCGTLKDTSEACRVSLTTVYREIARQAPKPPPAYVAHADWWKAASFSDRVDFVRACGVSEVWDALSTAVV